MFKLKKEIRRKVLPLLLGLVIVLGAFGCQAKKIKDLESQVNTKTEQKVEVKTTMYENTIRNKFNEMKSYKVEDGMINFKHDFKWQEKTFLGLKKKVELSAFGDVRYEYLVDLNDVSIIEDENTLTILFPEAYLNRESINVDEDSLQFIESGSNSNIFADKDDERDCMIEFIKTMEEKACKKIDRYYGEESKNHIPYVAKKQVKRLVESFVHDKEIIVKMKDEK